MSPADLPPILRPIYQHTESARLAGKLYAEYNRVSGNERVQSWESIITLAEQGSVDASKLVNGWIAVAETAMAESSGESEQTIVQKYGLYLQLAQFSLVLMQMFVVGGKI